MVTSAAYAAAIRSLWDGVCTVYTTEKTLDEGTGRTKLSSAAVAVSVPCRLSHTSSGAGIPLNGGNLVTQGDVIYLDSSVSVPEGAQITVTQNGVTETYVRSGKPRVFTTHQEVPVELAEGYA